MLHGSKEKRIAQLGLDEMPTYGVMRSIDRKQIRAYIDYLIQEGYLETSTGEYAVLYTADKAYDVLFDNQKVFMAQRRKKVTIRQKPIIPAENHEDLFEHLRAVRTQLAKQERVPAYIILSNAVLVDMAQKRPHTREELLEVSGIGEVKAQRYGKVFLNAILEWEDA